ncbi:ADP,ATP carrier protein 2, mitochondrial-like isoform X1 [Triticum dicoccoides]|uniref:ADP,ATP carrier protein 2, mitochondrial-like isoform X1 n=1 Tax=Triticum dicoccoides TaxID=85692 RepID=UPI00162C9CEA|nr:ADP,ATP carrier protein 2, mitochondrial-like isoform X1 [Triticum dicoccoides]XP_037473076.1 ADP,ATP carrier protein 2, mitochondrial-like isoform X1 [Triticum dicoccoides]
MAERHNQPGVLEKFFLAGGVSVISKSAAAPFERVKLLLQYQEELVRLGILPEPFKGITDCCKRLVKTEGLRSLWRGNLANVMRYFPQQSLVFSLNEYCNAVVLPAVWGRAPPNSEDRYSTRFFWHAGCGSAAGAMSLLLFYPLEVSRTKLANDLKMKGKWEFDGHLDVYRRILGPRAHVEDLYRGYLVSSYGAGIYRGLYFGLYGALKSIVLTGSSKQDDFLANFALAWMTTNMSAFATYPIDTIRRRMMMNGFSFSEVLLDVGATPRLLYKGAGANILRSGVAGAFMLAGYDQVQASLTSRGKV